MKKRGFTLIELMVVIAIIGLLAMVGLNFDFNKKTDLEKRDRLVESIRSIIHSTSLGVSSGRGVASGTGIINPTSTRIQISTGSMSVYYYSGTSIMGTGTLLVSPFFGDASFVINDIYGIRKDALTGSISPLPVDIVFDNMRTITFTGSDINLDSYIGLGIEIRYHGSKKTLEFDRRFGRIITK